MLAWIPGIIGLALVPAGTRAEGQAVGGPIPGQRVLVAVHSFTGRTARVAGEIAAMLGGQVARYGGPPAGLPAPGRGIDPTVPAKAVRGATDVYLGFPIWGGAPSPDAIRFVESHSLTGKRVIPFYTYLHYADPAALLRFRRVLQARDAAVHREVLRRRDLWEGPPDDLPARGVCREVADAPTPSPLCRVPAGLAWTCDDGGPAGPRGYVPPRRAFVEAFDIQEREVTAAEYDRCVVAGSCRPLEQEGACTFLVADGGRQVAVPCAGYADAKAYCASIGMRLPTEAEWIRAARGDGVQPFPWGQEFDGAAGNLGEPPSRGYPAYALAPERPSWRGDAFKGLAPGCTFPAGRSAHGLCDLAGNLAEWVAPVGSERPGSALLKGGSWLDAETSAFRIGSRSWHRKELGFYLTGFRCARTAR